MWNENEMLLIFVGKNMIVEIAIEAFGINIFSYTKKGTWRVQLGNTYYLQAFMCIRNNHLRNA